MGDRQQREQQELRKQEESTNNYRSKFESNRLEDEVSDALGEDIVDEVMFDAYDDNIDFAQEASDTDYDKETTFNDEKQSE